MFLPRRRRGRNTNLIAESVGNAVMNFKAEQRPLSLDQIQISACLKNHKWFIGHKELTDFNRSVSSFYESWNQCCQNVAIGNLDKP